MLSVEMLLIAGRAVFLLFSFIVAAIDFTRWRRSAEAQTEQLLANHAVVLRRLADLEARVDATNVSIAGLREIRERPQHSASTGSAGAPGYQIAMRLARGGASVAELISGCGISSHEAELVHRLHSPHSRSAPRKAVPTRQDAA